MSLVVMAAIASRLQTSRPRKPAANSRARHRHGTMSFIFGEDEVRLSIFRSLGEKFVKVDLPSAEKKFRSRRTILN